MMPRASSLTARPTARTLSRRLAVALSLPLVAAALMAARPAHAADDSLFQDLGGQPGLTRLVNDFVPRLTRDDRLQPFFGKVNVAHIEESLGQLLCQVTGGPCEYEGPAMDVAHQDLEIRTKDFNALVEVLERTMDDEGIPFAVQRRLLARLAPLHRQIVNTP